MFKSALMEVNFAFHTSYTYRTDTLLKRLYPVFVLFYSVVKSPERNRLILRLVTLKCTVGGIGCSMYFTLVSRTGVTETS